MDSSQRVPPMSPCPPLIITRVCPWLINHLSDPWNFNKSNGILFRSNWRKPYPKFYGLELLIIKGSSRKLARRYPPTFWGGLLIRCWHYMLCKRLPEGISPWNTWSNFQLAKCHWLVENQSDRHPMLAAPRLRQEGAREPALLSLTRPAELEKFAGQILINSDE